LRAPFALTILQVQPQIDSVVFTWRFLDVDAFDWLEVAELIQSLDAVLERFGIEDAALDETDLTPNHAFLSRRASGEREAIDEKLHPFSQPHRDVDDRRRRRGLGLQGVGGVRFGGRRTVAKPEVRIARELKVPASAIRLARPGEPLANRFFASAKTSCALVIYVLMFCMI